MLTGFGADLVLHEIARGLSRKGYEVEVLASVKDTVYEHSDYEIKSLPVPARSFFPAYERNACRNVKRILASRYDVMLMGTFPFFSLIPALSAVMPCLAIEFGVCLTTGFSIWKKLNFAYMKHAQENVYFPKADRIVVISDFLKRQLPRTLHPKTEVIYCGGNHYDTVPQGPEKRETFRKQIGIKPEEVVALYVGRINPREQPYKGTAELIRIYESVKSISPFRLMMVGRGTGDDAELLGRHGIVACLDRPASEMPAIYAASDIFVTCTKWEGFDLPLLEAQYFGKPFVAYRIGAHPEIAKSGHSGFLVDSRSEFAEALVKVVSDRLLRRELGEEGSRWARTFTWEKAVDEYDRVIRHALNMRRSQMVSASTPPPLVSVVLVNYHAPLEMLERCLESLARQTISGVEVILVDNGSFSDIFFLSYIS
jgi:glycosyltransferase involved in cell wall biosynthesis